MKRTTIKLLIALTALCLAIGLSREPQPASGWSAFPTGGTHAELSDRVISWLAEHGWRYQAQTMHPDDFRLVALASAAPDAAHDCVAVDCALGKLNQLLLIPPEELHAAIRDRDFPALQSGAGGWHKFPGAVGRAMDWIQDAKSSAPDLTTRMIWAGYALHYAQDAVNPPHVDNWAEGTVEGTTFASCIPFSSPPLNGTPNPHTLWEIKDQGLLGDYWGQIDLSTPPGFSPSDVQPARLEQGIVNHAMETGADWPNPSDPTDAAQWRIWDPFSATLIADDLVRADVYCGYAWNFTDRVLPLSVRTDRPGEQMTNEQKARNALWRAAVVTRDLLIYAFDLEPPGGWPAPTANVDLALIIDSSGSMSWNDPSNLRKTGAKILINSALDGDHVAVIDFDSGVRVPGPLARIPDGRDDLLAAVDTIDSSGGTNVGIGVQAACDELEASTSGNNKAAILLTDGQGSFSNQHQCFIDNGWPIYTIGLSSGADRTLLERIATETGGTFDFLTGADQLASLYLVIRSRLAGSEPILDLSALILPLAEVLLKAIVPDGFLQMSWLNTWDGSTVDMTLVAPSGREIDCTTMAPDVSCDEGPTFELINVQFPEPGEWSIRLFGTDVPPGGELASVVVTGIPLSSSDTTPPTTTISLDPSVPNGDNGWYVSPVTVTLTAEDDPGGSGVASTEYRLDGGSWQPYVGLFTLLTDDTTTVEARSTDNAANVEDPPASETVQIDQTAPGVNIEVPTEGVAVQDGVTLAASASDATSGVADVRLYVREDDGGTGIDVGLEDLPATYNSGTGHWEYWIDSTLLPDAYYVALAKAEDSAGNEGWSDARHFSIRNWAVLELLPASESNKAGRTMPVKFSLRIAAAVDPAQPFVYNEDLTIKIYETGHPGDVFQTSMYGDGARNYRIDEVGEQYITNFKTLKRPKDYTVDIWRHNTIDSLVGSFGFRTVK
jgi:hypothetical protein